MPISSTQISAMAGGFNQQVMLGMQHSAMITQQFGGYAPNPGTQPVATQGQNFANLMTMAGGQYGLNQMQQHGGNGGLGGAASSFGQMGLSQMMYGAQQQQMFQTNMQQAYRFPSAQGGRGFNQQQLQGMGANMREMAQERGPAGEQTSFDELSRLATNMGRMGLAQNVHTVKDFNEKFKKMVENVKTMATELGTSLEDAQKMMVSMKGAGIFSGQAGVATMMRQGALAGNISIAEMSAGAMMGSQMSRSIGGKGRAGAMAGMKAASNVGVAQQAGVLSEEDIYDVTGLGGAEGRQAFTQEMLSDDARFFRGSMGRRALAAMAGPGGKLNAQNVARFKSGGVGTGETMGMAGKQLGQVGKAEFLLNEGRLRGEAMQAFGGMGRAMVARGWLEERGMDPNSARGQLFLQRKFGYSREKAEALGKMVENLPLMEQQRKVSQQQDELERSLETASRKSSPTEVVKKFEQARDKVNDKIRQFGADVNSQTAGFLDNVLGKIMKNYERKVDRTLAPALASLREGATNADEILGREFGLGSKASIGDKNAVEAYRKTTGRTGEVSARQVTSFVGANKEALQAAGYDPFKLKTKEQIAQVQNEMRRKGLPELVGQLTEESKYSTQEAEKRGLAHEALRGETMRGKGVGDLNVLKDPLETASLFAGGEETSLGRGIKGVSDALTDRIFGPLAKKQDELLKSGFAGDAARKPGELAAKGMGWLEKKARGAIGDEKVTGFAGKDISKRIGAAVHGLIGEDAESRVETLIQGALGGAGTADEAAYAEFMEGTAGKNALRDAFSSDSGVRAAATKARGQRVSDLKAQKELSTDERAELGGLERASSGQAFMEWMLANPGKQPKDKDWEAIAKKAGVPKDKVQSMKNDAVNAHGRHLDAAQKLLLEEGTKAAQTELGKLEKQAPALAKAVEEGKISDTTKAYLDKAQGRLERRASVTSPEEAAASFKEEGDAFKADFMGTSAKDQRARSKELRDSGAATDEQLNREERLESLHGSAEKFKRAGARGGTAGSQRELAKGLGITLSAKELRGKSVEETTRTMLEKSGVAGLGMKEDTTDTSKMDPKALEAHKASREAATAEFEGQKKLLQEKLLAAGRAKDPKEKAMLLAEATSGDSGKLLQKGREDKQNKKAEAEDPSFRQLQAVVKAAEATTKAVNKIGGEIVTAVSKKTTEAP